MSLKAANLLLIVSFTLLSMYIYKLSFSTLSMKPNHLNIFHGNGLKFQIILTADLKLNSIHYLIRLNLVLVSSHLCFQVTLKFNAVIKEFLPGKVVVDPAARRKTNPLCHHYLSGEICHQL